MQESLRAAVDAHGFDCGTFLIASHLCAETKPWYSSDDDDGEAEDIDDADSFSLEDGNEF